ncbi:IMPACT family protein [Marinicella sp. W31]|uniref:IMPACT family protein n=1 Tax=Marinicella sp. W31 TaxID=3023713 RepID=UPI003757C213
MFKLVAAPVDNPSEALAFLKQISEENATHNCWAYKAGNAYRFNDDGEPSGTAGKPIFMAIESSGFDDICAVVIRYYGGTKLGTGGLARAYGKVVKEALSDAPYNTIRQHSKLHCTVNFDNQQNVYYLIDKLEAKIIQQSYQNDAVIFEISLLEELQINFEQQLMQLTKGSATIKRLTS